MAIIDIFLTIAIDKGNQMWHDVLFKIAQRGAVANRLFGRGKTMEDMIVRRVRSQTVLNIHGWEYSFDYNVVDRMPRGGEGERDIFFFTLGRFVSDEGLEKEYELRGLVPADPYSLAAVNEADPTFADQKPNGTHWKDADGHWCRATFSQWVAGHVRIVDVGPCGHGWRDDWWFAGVRK